MDLHASLSALKLIIALWRAAPFEQFPIKCRMNDELNGMFQEFSKGVELCLTESRMCSGWKSRTREFVNDTLSGPESTFYDRDDLDTWLSILYTYRGESYEAKKFSYESTDDLVQETLPIFEQLIWEIALNLSGKERSDESPLNTLEQAVAIWVEMIPSSIFDRDSDLLKQTLFKRQDRFKASELATLHIVDFLKRN